MVTFGDLAALAAAGGHLDGGASEAGRGWGVQQLAQ